jgi:hypothetical protein
MKTESKEISKLKKIENEIELIKALILTRGNYLIKQIIGTRRTNKKGN